MNVLEWISRNCRFAQRPRHDIDWDLVARRTEEGLVLNQIAKELGIPKITLWRRFTRQFPPGTPLSQRMRENTARFLSEQQSERIRENWLRPEFRQKQMERERPWATPEGRQESSERMRERWADEDYRQMMSGISREQWADEDFRQMQSEKMRGQLADPEFIRRQRESVRELWARPGFRQMMSELARERWNNPDFRQMMTELVTERWDDPEYRQKMHQLQMSRPQVTHFWQWLAKFPLEKQKQILNAIKATGRSRSIEERHQAQPATPIPVSAAWVSRNCRFAQQQTFEFYEPLKSARDIKALIPQMIPEVQRVYDEWTQDDEGLDIDLGEGGICQDIAEAVASVLNMNGIDAGTVAQQMVDQHVYVVAKVAEGIFEVDIPPSLYESGSGYRWKKRPGVRFGPDFFSVSMMDGDPSKFEQFLDY